jgi:hypothetical protein
MSDQPVEIHEDQMTIDVPVADQPHARGTDPWTSHASARETEAAEGTTSKMKPGTLKHQALAEFRRFARTAASVGESLDRPEIHKRVSDLKNAGLIVSVGEVYYTKTNRWVQEFAMTQLGYEVLQKLDAGEVVQL